MKKLLALLLAMVMVLSLAACGDDSGSSSKGSSKKDYEKPLELMMDQANTKKASEMQAAGIKVLNGLCESEYKDMVKLMQKSEDYDEDDVLERYEERIDALKDEYGSDYKFSYKIEEKEELEEDDLKDVKNTIKDNAKQLKSVIDEMEEFDSDEWEYLGEELGLTKSDTKKILDIMKSVFEEMKNVEVTEGYELTVTITTTGSELDEPEEDEETICVYKVNGIWVSEESLSMLRSFLYLL